jgi:ankyrin repeat protein
MFVLFGADVNKANLRDCTLYAAAFRGDTTMCQFLIKQCGADVNKANLDGRTPLYVSAARGDIAVCQYLVKQCGADINKVTNSLHSPFFVACEFGYLEVAKALIALGADANLKTIGGTSLPAPVLPTLNFQTIITIGRRDSTLHGSRKRVGLPD